MDDERTAQQKHINLLIDDVGLCIERLRLQFMNLETGFSGIPKDEIPAEMTRTNEALDKLRGISKMLQEMLQQLETSHTPPTA